MVRVLLTRPQAGSERTARELEKWGYDVVIEPLLTIRSVSTPPPDFHNVQAVIVTSAHAFDCLDCRMLAAAGLLTQPCFCVGTATAAAARAFGFTLVQHTEGDGAVLAEYVAGLLDFGAGSLLHLAGREADDKARKVLQASGFAVESWVVYEAAAATQFSPAMLRLLHRGEIDAVPVFSSRTAQILVGLIRQYGLEAGCQSMIALGISNAVQKELEGLSWRRLEAAPHPSEAAVLQILQELLPVRGMP